MAVFPWSKKGKGGAYRVFDNLERRQAPYDKEAIRSSCTSVFDEELKTLRGRRQNVDSVTKVEMLSVIRVGESSVWVIHDEVFEQRRHFCVAV